MRWGPKSNSTKFWRKKSVNFKKQHRFPDITQSQGHEENTHFRVNCTDMFHPMQQTKALPLLSGNINTNTGCRRDVGLDGLAQVAHHQLDCLARSQHVTVDIRKVNITVHASLWSGHGNLPTPNCGSKTSQHYCTCHYGQAMESHQHLTVEVRQVNTTVHVTMARPWKVINS